MVLEFCKLILIYFSDVEKERLENSAVPTNIYDSMCVPDLGAYLEYNNPPILPGDDRKPIPGTPTPAHTPTSAASTPTNNNFIHEGKSV